MAEKNTESTAVNELIELVATQKPLPPDPSEDLMFAEKPAPRRATKQMSPPRMTATVPPVRAAGEVAPLPPPARVPSGTQQGIKTIKMPPPPNVRISTAPPSRSVTIPPVARPIPAHPSIAQPPMPPPPPMPMPTPPPAIAQPPMPHASMTLAPMTLAPMTLDFEDENDVTNPEHDAMSRVTKPTLPPPLPTVRGVGSGTAARPSLSRPSIPTQSFDYPVVKHPAQELPVVTPPAPTVAPSIAAPLVLENELATSAAVTNPSMHAMRLGPDSTHQVPKAGDWKAIVGKLIAPMIVLVVVGIFVGGYFAFDGEGGKKRTPKPEAGKVSMPVTQAAAGGEPVKPDPSAAEQVAASADVKGEPPTKVDDPSANPASNTAQVDDPSADPASNSAASNPAASNTAASNTAASNTAASNTASNTAASNTSASNTSGSNPSTSNTAAAASNTSASNTAASNTAASNTAASNSASNTSASNPSASNPSNTAASNTSASNTAASNTAASNTAASNTAASNTAASNPSAANTAVAKPKLVDIRVDSNPSGATVNLIDRGKSMYLGTTPLSAAVDASRKYELVFSYENRSTVIESLDPSQRKRVTVRLSRAKRSSSAPASASASEPKTEAKSEEPKRERHRSSSKKSAIDAALAGAIESPKDEEKKPEKTEKSESKPEPVAKANTGGEGTLMISSKPPCEIVIDGKSTGLTTPQRSIPLPAGTHKITLVNGAEGIKKTVSVQITADKPTKVIQDFMK